MRPDDSETRRPDDSETGRPDDPETRTIEVLYEDAAMLFINKPAGIVVQQRMHEPGEVFLLDLVEKQFGPVYLMQRLDRGTSGVMFFSRLSNINVRLTRQFERKRIRKRYLALCEGELREQQTIDAPLARVGAIKFGVREHGKRAVTHLAPLEATPHGTLLEIVLETGRTHQIRVHLSAIGHPLAGDWLYGDRNALRPMLHASELEMMHPLTNEPLRVAAPVPDDFREEAMRRGIRHWQRTGPTSEKAS
ncbi:MAG TPA: RluA family pseudouridine synthase [Thermoanaerobaculia bacterium]|nr:RluA family pseudouridine synthase [Thermoanaerobaculia bacterium]